MTIAFYGGGLVAAGAILAATSGRAFLAGAVFGFATLAKVYPLVLGPVLAAWAWRRGARALALGALGFALVAAALVALVGWPDLAQPTSGFTAYARAWRNNGGLFALVAAVLGLYYARFFVDYQVADALPERALALRAELLWAQHAPVLAWLALWLTAAACVRGVRACRRARSAVSSAPTPRTPRAGAPCPPRRTPPS